MSSFIKLYCVKHVKEVRKEAQEITKQAKKDGIKPKVALALHRKKAFERRVRRLRPLNARIDSRMQRYDIPRLAWLSMARKYYSMVYMRRRKRKSMRKKKMDP